MFGRFLCASGLTPALARGAALKKIFASLATLAVFTAVLTLGGGTVNAAGACSVPGPGHLTIQSAVNDTTCNPINVAPGAYPENVSIARTLTLNGAQAGNPVAARTFGSATEST